MRIISASVTLRIILLIILLPNISLAAEDIDPNETQINTKNELVISKGILGDENEISITFVSYIDSEINQDKTKEELKREKALERFAQKREQTVFPKGKFTINASAYTAAADECGKSDGITASGLKVKEKETIACPPQFPFGVKLNIEGMGVYVCQDRGGAIKGNHIDIYMETKSQAFAFGRKNLLAEVVE